MIFCQYNYREFHNYNTYQHPLPYSTENWCKMVNDNYAYCKDFNILKWLVFYFWVVTDRVNYSQLPSFHPYWKNQVKKDVIKELNRLIGKYNECKQNPDMIRYYFNASITLHDIAYMIDNCRAKLKQ